MDSIELELRNQPTSEIRSLHNRQYFQQPSIIKTDRNEKRSVHKRVQFNIRTPTGKPRRDYNISIIDGSQNSSFEDHDYAASSTQYLTTELIETNNKQTCNRPSKVIAFAVVILIIVAIAIAIGVTVGVKKAQQNTSNTATTISFQTSLSTIAAQSSISIGNPGGPPCSSYTTINDPSRNIYQSSLFGNCDVGPLFNISNGGSWIRFVGTGGTIIPMTPPHATRCGGYLAGWFNGTLPTTMGTVVNATVCFDVNISVCTFTVEVSVISCGGFYVYFLPPAPICNGRYCTT
ncbi:unnamed protein product [Rotaria socialis]|uniref:Uncharacterized protein n=1 Tax=Rotaria socialis TaxID=392032 RepID=A0A817PEP8_9BILA|nr:unnamed protein product [Rotaria socialis]CAF4416443.1 unnamed protein product [Rotaria socialis]